MGAFVISAGIFASLRSALGGAAAVAALMASPALANSSSSADITAPLRAEAAKAAPVGDEEFRALFSSWTALDKGAGFAASRSPALGAGPGAGLVVAVPSRMPVDTLRQTSGFGMRWHPVLGGRRQHKGVDLSAPVGTPVYATADGVIGRADWFSSYGLFVSVEHGGALETRYGHLSRLNVAAGQAVHKGDVIGFVGTTGRSTGPHLHYEVRVAGEAVNPIPYMEGQGTTAPASLLAISAPAPKAIEADGDE